ncbi:TrbI/VirB10 family protein [Microvirga tunisiensis]|uniref:TrbI/VirB10 family protein n=1 Tax=Microvirga tunisiensis TaxID=2108360 RepID=A0A5N7MLM1_9HYPH|nr:TrbI/VirB10 family protein [Microvirga tunisiensis]MPR09528.1 TrbI/VirB10 family protein [Microvirga tunisiensis]MPR27748.1 TrbI/VirB10 family protein [Microvirga tunisiensis]
MALDDYRKARLKWTLTTVLGMIVFGSIAWGLYQMSLPAEAAREPIKMQVSQPIYERPAPEPEKPPLVIGSLTTSKDRILMGDVIIGESSYSGSLTITAADRPVTIKSVAIAFAQEVGIKLDAKNCLEATLQPDQNCTVDILFDPLNPVKVEKQIIIQAESDNSDGSRKAFSREISLTGSATKAPPKEPIAIAAPNAQYAQETVVEIPNPALVAYLQNRQQLGGFAAEDLDTGPQKPQHDDWSSIGIESNMSTFPVDMSRVVTMDKPIPAVVKIGIDTRYASRAVAQVERDIYGGEGTLVLIPRGSTVIGSVGAVSSTAEEKVVIAWERIVRPDGAAFKIEGYAGDAMGRSGVIGHIDNRYVEKYGNTILASIINVGVTLGLNGKQEVQTGGYGFGSGAGYGYGQQQTVAENARSVATKQFREDFEKVIDDIQEQGSQIPPIRTIPAGTRVTIFPNQDLWLRPIVPTETMKAEARRQRAWGGFTRTDQVEEVTQQTTSRAATVSGIQYDPVTGQPLRAAQPATPSVQNLDRNGFPILPGNLGLQAPGSQVQPPQSRTSGVAPASNLPAHARPSPGPALNGQDASASAQIKSRETSGSSPWSSIK